MSDRIAMLERIPLFAGTDEVTLERIAELTEVEEVAAGTTLTHEGRHEGYFYMIVAGTVEVSREGVVIDTSGHGGFIGEISMLDLGPGPPPRRPSRRRLLLKVNSVGFEALIAADPAVRKALEAEAARRLERIDIDGGS